MRLATSLTAFGVLSLLVAACADRTTPTAVPEPPNFIINGEPTGDQSFPNVGALLFDFDSDGVITGADALCSGSLVSPTVFLTAGHCVSFFPPDAQLFVSFEADLFAKRRLNAIAAKEFHAHPEFNPPVHDWHDLAVVILPAGKTKGIEPLQLPREGLLDDLAAQGGLAGQVFLNVGYGVDATQRGVPGFSFDGVRKVSKSLFQALEPVWLWLSMNQSRTDEGGDCFGDSGSPKFFEGNTRLIVATVTTGDRFCRATSKDYRLDTPTARAFLGQFVPLP